VFDCGAGMLTLLSETKLLLSCVYGRFSV